MTAALDTFYALFTRGGDVFWRYALTMLIQTSVLIVALLALDAILRRHARAVLRYALWMLLLVKLVLPPGLSTPVSVGAWIGRYLDVAHMEQSAPLSATAETTSDGQGGKTASATVAVSPTPSGSADVASGAPHVVAAGAAAVPNASAESPGRSRPAHTAPSPGWKQVVFLGWFVVVCVFVLLLVQRWVFVRGLVRQAEPADENVQAVLDECCAVLGVSPKRISLRMSPNMVSPAVCGLRRPVVLLPSFLLAELDGERLRSVMLHEVAHVKRFDLPVNMLQTVLQAVYFYNPLLWLANSRIRRAREEAVDETVLVGLGEEARGYSRTLIDIAEMAFQRPALSLRLIGVVESKSALARRIKHILARPIPRTARIGLAGSLITLLAAVLLIPMAAGQRATGTAGRVVDAEQRSAPSTRDTRHATPMSQLERKLTSIVIPEIDFRRAKVSDIVNFLTEASREFDPDGADATGVNIVLTALQPDALPLVTFTLRDISLLHTLRIVAEVTGLQLNLGDRVARLGTPGQAILSLEEIAFPIVPAARKHLLAEAGANADWRPLLMKMGVQFPRGALAEYTAASGELRLRNTLENLAATHAVLRGLHALNDSDGALAEKLRSPVMTVAERTTTDERMADEIRLQLASIVVPEINFRQANIHDVMHFLRDVSTEHGKPARTGARRGVNIVLNMPAIEREHGGSRVPLITFSAKEISLKEALRIVTEVIGTSYRVENSAVILGPTRNEAGKMHYSVLATPGLLQEAVAAEAGGDWGQYFAERGVHWPAGSALYYAPWTDKLVVANTAHYVGMIARAVRRFAAAEQPVAVGASLFLVPSSSAHKLELAAGFDPSAYAGPLCLSQAEFERLTDTLHESDNVHTVGAVNSVAELGKEAIAKSVRQMTYASPDNKKRYARELGFILQSRADQTKGGLQVTLMSEYVDLVGWLHAGDRKKPVFETLQTSQTFPTDGRSYHLLRATRAAHARLPDLKAAKSLGADLAEHAIDAFLLLSVEHQNVREAQSCGQWHPGASCTFVSAGRAAQKAIRNATRNGSILSDAQQVELWKTLSGIDEVELLGSLPTFLSPGKTPVVKWVREITYPAGQGYETREYGQTAKLLWQGESLVTDIELVYPSVIDGTVQYSSPAVLAVKRKSKLSLGNAIVSPIAPPPGVLPEGHMCYMLLATKRAGDH